MTVWLYQHFMDLLSYITPLFNHPVEATPRVLNILPSDNPLWDTPRYRLTGHDHWHPGEIITLVEVIHDKKVLASFMHDQQVLDSIIDGVPFTAKVYEYLGRYAVFIYQDKRMYAYTIQDVASFLKYHHRPVK